MSLRAVVIRGTRFLKKGEKQKWKIKVSQLYLIQLYLETRKFKQNSND